MALQFQDIDRQTKTF